MATQSTNQADHYGLLPKTAPVQAPASSVSSGTSSGSSAGTKTENGVSVVNGTNMDPASTAALNMLIAQLLGGGTKEMAQQSATRKGEVNAVQAQRAGYSKEAAFGDAQGLIAQTMRRTMESLIPAITRAAEGAGTSGNSMRALLLQDAAQRAAESSSVAGLGAATAYGGVAASLSNTLEALTRPNDSVTQALLNALNIAKGAVNNTTTQTSGTTSTTGNTQGATNEQKNIAPTAVAPQMPQAGGMQYYGPVDANPAPSDFLSTALYQLSQDRYTNNLTF